MADLSMDVDTAITVPVNILPLLDDTTFKDIETAVAYNAAGLSLNWNFVTSTAYTCTAVTPTDTGGNYDWSEPLADVGMYKIEIPASGGATINNDTEGVGWFTGVATGVLPWRGPTIEFRRAALNDLFRDGSTASTNLEDFFDGTGYAGGTAKLTVDVTAISGDSTAADNLEDVFEETASVVANLVKAFDGSTGYGFTGCTMPTTTAVTNGVTLGADAITADKIADNAFAAEHFAAGCIDNATFAADVGSTAYATNIIALAARKAIDDYDAPTKTEMDTAFAALASTGDVATANWAAGERTLTALDEDDTTIDINAAVAAGIGTGAALTAVPWNAAWDAEVQSECADALTAFAPPTKVEMTAAFTEIKGATWAGTDTLEGIHDDVAAVSTTIGAAGAGLTSVGLATDALDADALKTDAVTEIVHGLLDHDRTGHTTAHSVGLALNRLVQRFFHKSVEDAVGFNLYTEGDVADGKLAWDEGTATRTKYDGTL